MVYDRDRCPARRWHSPGSLECHFDREICARKVRTVQPSHLHPRFISTLRSDMREWDHRWRNGCTMISWRSDQRLRTYVMSAPESGRTKATMDTGKDTHLHSITSGEHERSITVKLQAVGIHNSARDVAKRWRHRIRSAVCGC
jgi:hypothetical protein